MNDEPAIATLRRALNAATAGHHLDPEVAATAWADAHAARPHRLRTALAVAASVIAVGGGAVTLTLTRGGGATSPRATSNCRARVSTDRLPTWAREGFSSQALHVPHVVGAKGDIVGILFGPLRAHQPAGTNNKVLWVAKDGFGSLHISARLEGSNLAASRTVNLGPSIVDVPAAGCWQMTLTWPGHSDTLALPYQ
ncbi:MAG: hypothetical protein ABR571_16105 [Jatrophihabitans sp.]|uniref:hypothetical protein n=1 Tax=Jatrophihabitans sp. TaxID=1932789 RepID=UPI0039156D8E